MDQIKIGKLLRELRKEKNRSQEQLAAQFGVTSRSVSRWENGNTMPDISIIIELADYYDIDIRELLSGERKSEEMKEDLKETLVMVADYTEEEKNKILNKVTWYGLISTFVFAILIMMYAFNMYKKSDFLNDLFTCLQFLGIIFSTSTVFAGLQLSGNLSKQKINRMAKVSLFICLAATVVIMALIYFMVSA